MDGSWNIGSIGFAGPPLRGPSSTRLVAEPPLSPPVSGSSPVASAQPVEPSAPLEPASPPAPQPFPATSAPAYEATPKPAASLESLLMRFRLITSDQLDEALRERAETGNDVGAIVVARGWVNEDQLARLLAYAPAFPAEPLAATAEPLPATLAAEEAPGVEPELPAAETPSESEQQPEPSLEARSAPELEPVIPAEPAEPAHPFRHATPWPDIPPALELVDEPSAAFAPAPVEVAREAEATSEPEAQAMPEAEVEVEPEPEAQPEPEPEPEPQPEADAFAEPAPPFSSDFAPPAEPEPDRAPEPAAEAAVEPARAESTAEPKVELEPLASLAAPAPDPEPEVETAAEATEAVQADPAPEAEPTADDPAPESDRAPEPVTTPPEPQVVRFVEPASIETIARVFVRLANGERFEAGSFDDMAAAKARAEEIVAQVSNGTNGWPFLAGRYVRPDAVVSVDLDATVVRSA